MKTNIKKAAVLLVCLVVQAGMLPVAAAADEQGAYLGVFGGLGKLGSTSLRQQGTVILPHPLPGLPIDADGHTDRKSVGMGGVQSGYQWAARTAGASRWTLRPAVELEGIYLGRHTPLGDMPVTPRALGTQYVTLPMTVSAALANVVLTVRTPYSDRILPYLGAGAGVARLSIKNAYSANPSEPGINHFNAGPDSSRTAFVMQLKLGVKGQLSKNMLLFTEYRYLHIHSTHHVFGETDYPGVHLPTQDWDVRLGRLKYGLFVAGLQYRF